jgi:hypothetical protein
MGVGLLIGCELLRNSTLVKFLITITGDIEFVCQAIGHSKLESTSSYVENLSDEDRRLRMEQITSPE